MLCQSLCVSEFDSLLDVLLFLYVSPLIPFWSLVFFAFGIRTPKFCFVFLSLVFSNSAGVFSSSPRFCCCCFGGEYKLVHDHC